MRKDRKGCSGFVNSTVRAGWVIYLLMTCSTTDCQSGSGKWMRRIQLWVALDKCEENREKGQAITEGGFGALGREGADPSKSLDSTLYLSFSCSWFFLLLPVREWEFSCDFSGIISTFYYQISGFLTLFGTCNCSCDYKFKPEELQLANLAVPPLLHTLSQKGLQSQAQCLIVQKLTSQQIIIMMMIMMMMMLPIWLDKIYCQK